MIKSKKKVRNVDGIIKQVKDILNDNEKILLTYSPSFNLIKLYIIIILGISSSVSFYLQLIFLGTSGFFFISEGFFIFSIILMIIFLFFLGILIPILQSKVKLNRSDYVFTNKKLLMSISKDLFIIPLENMKSVQSIKRKNYYFINIPLKESIFNRKNQEKTEIKIPIVPKDDFISEKIVFIIKSKVQA